MDVYVGLFTQAPHVGFDLGDVEWALYSVGNLFVEGLDADLELKGGGATGVFMGAAVAKTVLMNGNFEFHYDEDLSNVDSAGVYTVGGWRELNGQAEWVSL